MLRRYFAHFLLVLMFALVQIGAITHEISHLTQSTSHTQPDKNSPSEPCAQCVAFSVEANGLVSQFHFYPLNVLSTSLVSLSAVLASIWLAYAYRARAPPRFSL